MLYLYELFRETKSRCGEFQLILHRMRTAYKVNMILNGLPLASVFILKLPYRRTMQRNVGGIDNTERVIIQEQLNE